MGAGLSSVGGPLTINNSFFDNNQATLNVGGLSMLGGAMALIGLDFETGTPYENIPARITNTVFVNNTAGMWGGAILNVYHPDAEFINCTFYNNLDGSGNSIVHAGALPATPGTTYKNSIIWDNIAILEGDLGGGFVFGPSALSFGNCDVMGSGGSDTWNNQFMPSTLGAPYTTVATDLEIGRAHV